MPLSDGHDLRAWMRATSQLNARCPGSTLLSSLEKLGSHTDTFENLQRITHTRDCLPDTTQMAIASQFFPFTPSALVSHGPWPEL
jgi:hypothetical protein